MRIAIVVATAVLLAGCGSNSSDEAESSAPAEPASTTSTEAAPPTLTDEQRQQREQQFLYGLEQVGLQIDDPQIATTAGWRTCDLLVQGKGFIEVATTVVEESQGHLGIDQAGALGGVAIRWLCPEHQVVFR